MDRRNELLGIFLGVSLLGVIHIAGFLVVFILGTLIGSWIFSVFLPPPPYWGIIWFAISIVGIWLYQLAYVVPLILWFRRRGNPGMMKGIILGAVVTGLVSGTCFLAFIITAPRP